jgi:hypothetical protein
VALQDLQGMKLWTLRPRRRCATTGATAQRCIWQSDTVPDDNFVIADEDFLDEKLHDALAF